MKKYLGLFGIMLAILAALSFTMVSCGGGGGGVSDDDFTIIDLTEAKYLNDADDNENKPGVQYQFNKDALALLTAAKEGSFIKITLKTALPDGGKEIKYYVSDIIEAVNDQTVTPNSTPPDGDDDPPLQVLGKLLKDFDDDTEHLQIQQWDWVNKTNTIDGIQLYSAKDDIVDPKSYEFTFEGGEVGKLSKSGNGYVLDGKLYFDPAPNHDASTTNLDIDFEFSPKLDPADYAGMKVTLEKKGGGVAVIKDAFLNFLIFTDTKTFDFGDTWCVADASGAFEFDFDSTGLLGYKGAAFADWENDGDIKAITIEFVGFKFADGTANFDNDSYTDQFYITKIELIEAP